MVSGEIIKIYNLWFKNKGWKAFEFQKELLKFYFSGYSGILNAPTGSGKTYALWLPVLMEYLANVKRDKKYKAKGLQVLWITPVRSLANDIKNAMQEACYDLQIPWNIGVRTGDTTASERAKLKKNIPQCLITTPESLHLLLASKGYHEYFSQVKVLVADEWHELLGTKRGVQVELGFSRIKTICPWVKVWGISATIGNLGQAMEVLLGEDVKLIPNTIVKSNLQKEIEVETIIPDAIEKFPWGGHMGISLLPKVLEVIKKGRSVLVFTNTRSQTEAWYQRLLEKDPSLAGLMAIHHGSLSNSIRNWVEQALHGETIKVVICTSSLDLGVDFRPVETVIQIGGPKGVARFIQRAGRSGHQPGAKSKIFFVPTHSLELLEAAALKTAVKQGQVEDRVPLIRVFDVLVQYLVTLAVSDGFLPDIIKQEIRGTFAFQHITDQEWEKIMVYITSGGNALEYYDEYHKVVKCEDGLFRVIKRKIAMWHRLSIGTIVSDTMMSVKFIKGKKLGSIEEIFISRLKPGDAFSFAGKILEVVRIREVEVFVKLSKSKKVIIPQWLGGKMSLSSNLSEVMRQKLEAESENPISPEMQKLKPLLDLQKKHSMIPSEKKLLIERYHDRDGYHIFMYPFEGKLVNEGIAALMGIRISKIFPLSYSISINDYGFELLSDREIPVEKALLNGLFKPENLMEDIQAGLNASEMARRKFREIAIISGLIFRGYPGKEKRSNHLHSSSRLIFDVLSEIEPENLLLRQAYEEVRYVQLNEERLNKAISRINKQEIVIKEINKPTPFSFPLIVERFREKLSTEKLEDRVKRMLKQLEK
ncbi:MAG: ligase-associated DNA damage response DEXH box helicase [Bacteroidetes bacterium]|nr:ligase-associated DNA damage response DEXH box helicase [Bacteroidota bacterium]